MVVQNDAMSSELMIVVIISCVASLVSMVTVLLLCTCCYKRDTDSDTESLDDAEYYTRLPQDAESGKRDDVKQLRRHSWRERVEGRSKTSPLLARKTIKFNSSADKTMVTENIQPSQYSQSSLNNKLGIKTTAGNVQPYTDTPSHSNNVPKSKTTNDVAENDLVVAPNIEDMDPLDYSPERLGRMQFSVKYDFQEMTLTLRVMRAVELPAKDFSGTSDPYVKIMLLPDKKHKLQTNIKRRNLNPRWNEVFAFEGFPYQKLQSRTLYMQVLDYDRFSRDDPIGEVAIPLSDIDLAQGQTFWKSLQPCKGHAGKLGELLISLCYQPTVGRITIVIMKARELKAKDITGTSDPYVKIWMCHDGKKVEKKKTSIKERTLNPVFNESFIFNVPYEKIRQTSLLISCMDYDRMGRNELIGQVVLSSKSGPMEVKHWNEMFTKSRQPVAQWHILKDFG